MSIRFHCQACEARVKVPEGTRGRRVKCPRCGELQRVPTEEEASVSRRSAEPVAVGVAATGSAEGEAEQMSAGGTATARRAKRNGSARVSATQAVAAAAADHARHEAANPTSPIDHTDDALENDGGDGTDRGRASAASPFSADGHPYRAEQKQREEEDEDGDESDVTAAGPSAHTSLEHDDEDGSAAVRERRGKQSLAELARMAVGEHRVVRMRVGAEPADAGTEPAAVTPSRADREWRDVMAAPPPSLFSTVTDRADASTGSVEEPPGNGRAATGDEDERQSAAEASEAAQSAELAHAMEDDGGVATTDGVEAAAGDGLDRNGVAGGASVDVEPTIKAKPATVPPPRALPLGGEARGGGADRVKANDEPASATKSAEKSSRVGASRAASSSGLPLNGRCHGTRTAKSAVGHGSAPASPKSASPSRDEAANAPVGAGRRERQMTVLAVALRMVAAVLVAAALAVMFEARQAGFSWPASVVMLLIGWAFVLGVWTVAEMVDAARSPAPRRAVSRGRAASAASGDAARSATLRPWSMRVPASSD